MTHRITASQAWPLSGVASTRRLEAAAAASLAPHTLMARAGAAIARLARALAPHAGRYWIFCGPGNNGGDGFEAAVQLHRAGAAVTLIFGGDPTGLPPDARWAYERALHAGVPFSAQPTAKAGQQDLFIDAILGMGTRARATPAWIRDRLQDLREAPCPVLAVDIPSGLNADTGQYAEGLAPAGPTSATHHTLSLLTLKPGLFTGHGRDASGTVWFDPLGVTADHERPDAILSGPPAPAYRSHASHKGSFGDVSILGGESIGRRGMGMTGAALLAGSAALHAGAGRVLVALLQDETPTNSTITTDTAQPELMLRTPAALDLARGTVVCGCGGGEAVKRYLPDVLLTATRLVLDADALNSIAEEPALQQALRARAARGQITVLTPHPLEAARLLGTDVATAQADRLAAARRLGSLFDCVAVLKGSGTVIAAPGEITAINPTGNGRLATAGTGDVLAGMVGARMAGSRTGSGSMQVAEAFVAACEAVYSHGALADSWPEHLPLTAGALARRSSRS